MLKINQPDFQLCSLTCFLVFACSLQISNNVIALATEAEYYKRDCVTYAANFSFMSDDNLTGLDITELSVYDGCPKSAKRSTNAKEKN